MTLSAPSWSWPFPHWALDIFFFAIAAFVTIDVLIKKSDVRAALGWIAAAWLSPLVGGLLYYLFGINRVTRRALRLARRGIALNDPLPPPATNPTDPNMALLNESSRRITDMALAGGNEITILEGGDAAYPAMLAAIIAARHSVALASYIFRNDEAGGQFANALIDAHRRGVQVRVLLDSVGIGYFRPAIFRRLKQAGVPAARFLHTWVPWRMPFLNMRNHRKLLVADGDTAFIGGMNIGDEYSGRRAQAAGEDYVEDMHFRIQGPAVAQVMDTFARDWAFTTEEVLDGAAWWGEGEAVGSIAARGVRSGPDNDLYKIEMMLGAAIGLAKKRVRIVTPYFLPDQRLQFALAQAALRGVAVEIVLPQKCDYAPMDWAMRGHLRFFQQLPLDIYMTPPPFDHSKLAVVDDEWCLIGSSNWDARSLRLNFEFDLECYDRQLVRGLDRIIDGKIARADRLEPGRLAREPLWKQLRNAAVRLAMPYL
jgi:cardiolipin synthase